MLFIVLLGRVLFSAAASVVQKKATLAGVSVARLWCFTYALIALPALLAFMLGPKSTIGPGFWFNAIAAGVLDAVGNLAMVTALRSTHLSIFGPLNGFRPVLALLFGWVFLGEQPSALGAAGVIVTVLGVVLLLRDEDNPGGRWTSAVWRMLALRATGLILSTFGAVFLKRATLASSPALTIGMWILCGLPIFCVFAVFQRVPSPSPPSLPPSWLLAHAAFFFAMQWLTLLVFQSTFLAYSFAFFQLGMVFQVLMGHWLFDEPHFARRLICCAIIGIGALLVMLAQ